MKVEELYKKETTLEPTEDVYGYDGDYIGEFYTEDYVDWLKSQYTMSIVEKVVEKTEAKLYVGEIHPLSVYGYELLTQIKNEIGE